MKLNEDTGEWEFEYANEGFESELIEFAERVIEAWKATDQGIVFSHLEGDKDFMDEVSEAIADILVPAGIVEEE